MSSQKKETEVEIDKKMAENITNKTTNLNNEESGKKQESDNTTVDHKSNQRLPRKNYKIQPDTKNIKASISRYLNVSSQPTKNRHVTRDGGTLMVNVTKEDINGASNNPLSGFVPPRAINDHKHQNHPRNFKQRNDEPRKTLEDKNYSRSKSQPRFKDVPKNFEKEIKADGYKSDGEGLESSKNHNGSFPRNKRGRVFYRNKPRYNEPSKELPYNFKSTEDAETKEIGQKYHNSMHRKGDNDKRENNLRGRGFGRESHRGARRQEVREHNDAMKSPQQTNENQQEDLRHLLNERQESKRGVSHKNRRGRGGVYAGGDSTSVDQRHETKSVKKEFPKSFDKVDNKGNNQFRKDYRKKESFHKPPRRAFDDEDRTSGTSDFRKHFMKSTDGEAFCQQYTFKGGKQLSAEEVRSSANSKTIAQPSQDSTSTNEISQSNSTHQTNTADNSESSVQNQSSVTSNNETSMACDTSQKIEDSVENENKEKNIDEKENEDSEENINAKQEDSKENIDVNQEGDKVDEVKRADESEIKDQDEKQDELQKDNTSKKDELKNEENKEEDATQTNVVKVDPPANEDSSIQFNVDQIPTNDTEAVINDTKDVIEDVSKVTELSDELKKNNQVEEIVEKVDKIELVDNNDVVAEQCEDRLVSEKQTPQTTPNESSDAFSNDQKSSEVEGKNEVVVTKDDGDKLEVFDKKNDEAKQDSSEKKEEDVKKDDADKENIQKKEDDSKKEENTEKIESSSESNVDGAKNNDTENENKTSTQNEAITENTKESLVKTDDGEVKKEHQSDVASNEVENTQNSFKESCNDNEKNTVDEASSQDEIKNNETKELTVETNVVDGELKDKPQKNEELKDESGKSDATPNIQEVTSVTNDAVADKADAPSVAEDDKKIDA